MPPGVLESLRDTSWFQWWGKRVLGGNRELFRTENIILGPGDHDVVTYFWVLEQKRRKYKNKFKKLYLEEINKK